MALAGITRRISVRSLGTAGPIPMVWAPGLPTATIPDGASALAMALATIPGITRGGVPWATTAAAGIRITDGVRGAGQPSPMCMESGAIPPIRAPEPPGPIRIRATTVLRRAAPITTRKRAGAPSLGEGTTPISTRGTHTDTAAVPPTTRTPASLPVAERALWETSTPAKAQPGAAGSFTTPTQTRALLRVRTTSTRARTEPYIATTGTAAIGRATAAMAGNP